MYLELQLQMALKHLVILKDQHNQVMLKLAQVVIVNLAQAHQQI